MGLPAWCREVLHAPPAGPRSVHARRRVDSGELDVQVNYVVEVRPRLRQAVDVRPQHMPQLSSPDGISSARPTQQASSQCAQPRCGTAGGVIVGAGS